MGHVNIALFCCSVLEMGLPDSHYSRGMQEDLRILHGCMTVDVAGRLAQEEGFRVHVMETDECNLGEIPPGKSEIKHVRQRPAPLTERMAESLFGFFQSNKGETLVVMFGNNPLLSPEFLCMMEGLLHQEEEVLAIAEERQSGNQQRVVCAAMRTYHPALFADAGEGPPGGIGSFLKADAMLVPVKAVHDFSHPDKLALLLHEVERQMLLGRWYPVQTLATLERMHRKGMFEKFS